MGDTEEGLLTPEVPEPQEEGGKAGKTLGQEGRGRPVTGLGQSTAACSSLPRPPESLVLQEGPASESLLPGPRPVGSRALVLTWCWPQSKVV